MNPHIEFLDGIMLSSTRDIAPSCIENVEELIERQEKSLSQLDTKKSIVFDLIAKGKQLMENPDKPQFLDSHVGRIKDGWDETKNKASARLELLYNTKAAWDAMLLDSRTLLLNSRKEREKSQRSRNVLTLPEDKKDFVKKEVKAVHEKLEVAL